jgi:hypothetical protein
MCDFCLSQVPYGQLGLNRGPFGANWELPALVVKTFTGVKHRPLRGETGTDLSYGDLHCTSHIFLTYLLQHL